MENEMTAAQELAAQLKREEQRRREDLRRELAEVVSKMQSAIRLLDGEAPEGLQMCYIRRALRAPESTCARITELGKIRATVDYLT